MVNLLTEKREMLRLMKTDLQTLFKRGVFCLLGSLCMLQACAQTDASSNRNFLAKLHEIAPPVIRQCIIEAAKQLTSGEIADKAAHYHNALPSDDVAQAQFAVAYLSETCFVNLDITPPPENDNPWRSPHSFILALQNHVLLVLHQD